MPAAYESEQGQARLGRPLRRKLSWDREQAHGIPCLWSSSSIWVCGTALRGGNDRAQLANG